VRAQQHSAVAPDLAFIAVADDTRNRRTLPEPRSWVANVPNNGTFGRKKPVRWRRPSAKGDKALVEAARIQHEFAKAIRARLRETGVSTETLANNAGLTIKQLRRILRGEVHLTLADMRLLAALADLPLNAAGARE
jgi:ribosome-binding protein aMBF1 (putative translation factor)